MPRPTYDHILNLLRECQTENGALSTDEEWNILTRKALPFRMKRSAESARWVVLARFHASMITEELTGSVRRAVNLRDPSVLERCRWDGQEAVFILSSDPASFLDKLLPVLKNEGLQTSISYVVYSGNVAFDHDRAQMTLTPMQGVR